MGDLVYFCAGANPNIRPAKTVNALLLNVPDSGRDDKAIRDAKTLIRLSQPKILMLDSGGFALFQAQREGLEIGYDSGAAIRQRGRINLTPQHVIRAAVSIRPDIMVGLDFPIATIDDQEMREIEFRRKLGFNVSWAIETAEMRMKYCPETRFFLPIQCYNLEHLALFARLIQGVQYDGFSIPIRNLTLREIVLFLMRFREMGIRQVHLLGTTKIFAVALCAYMSRHFFDFVSFDSTNWSGKYGIYLNPYDFSSEWFSPDIIIDESIPMDCDCPWCSGKTFTYIKGLPKTEQTAFIRCHNHWVIEKAVRELYENAGTVSQLRTFLMRRCSDKEEVEELCRCLGITETFKGSPVDQWKDLLTAS